MTVSKNFVPQSPTKEHKKPREREDGSPVKKRRL
jgi:hypothetical protein